MCLTHSKHNMFIKLNQFHSFLIWCGRHIKISICVYYVRRVGKKCGTPFMLFLGPCFYFFQSNVFVMVLKESPWTLQVDKPASNSGSPTLLLCHFQQRILGTLKTLFDHSFLGVEVLGYVLQWVHREFSLKREGTGGCMLWGTGDPS